MSYRNDQFYMSGTFTTNFLFCYFHSTSITDYTFITYTFVFTARTFIILRRTKNTLAEQTVTFRFVYTIIYGFRFCNLTKRIFQDFFRRSKSDGNFRKYTLYL